MPRPEYFYYPITDRPYHQRFFYSRISKEDAKRKAEEWKARHITNPVTLAEVAALWLDDVKQDKTPQNYVTTYETPTRTHVLPVFGDTRMVDITEADIRTFYRQKAELSQSALDKIKISICGIFNYALTKHLIDSNPTVWLKPKSKQDVAEKRVLSQKQIAERYSDIERVCPEAAVILLTGMREGEISGIRTDDNIDLDPDIVPVWRSIMPDGTAKPPKNRKARFIPCKQAADLIRRLSLGKPHGYLFGNGEIPAKPSAIAGRIRRALSALELPTLTPHELRHTYATQLRRKGADIYTIQKLMGHSSVKVTANTYVKNEIDPLRDALKAAGMY